MIKIEKLIILDSSKIICHFNTGDIKLFDPLNLISDKYFSNILSDSKIYHSAKIGSYGEIYWEKQANIKNLKGELEICNYDISPEFAFYNSIDFKDNFSKN